MDTASGALAARPELAKVLDQLRPGDTLVVWKLDRLGRSLRHLLEAVGDLERRGVGFKSLRESVDTTTPGGRLVFHLFGALAEFERDLIRERTAAGLAAARARGRKGGRPPVMTPAKAAVARQLYDGRQHTVAAIARTLGVSLRFRLPAPARDGPRRRPAGPAAAATGPRPSRRGPGRGKRAAPGSARARPGGRPGGTRPPFPRRR